MMKRHRETEEDNDKDNSAADAIQVDPKQSEGPSGSSIGAFPPTGALGSGKSRGVPIPNHKVGRELMYERYAPQYDRLMNCHDCSLIRSFLFQLLLEVSSPDPQTSKESAGPLVVATGEGFSKQDDAASMVTTIETLRRRNIGVADFGCGSGRIGLMVLPCARRIMCFDRAAGMLKECKKNMEESATQQRIGLTDVSQLTGLLVGPSESTAPTTKVVKKFGASSAATEATGGVDERPTAAPPVASTPRSDLAAESPLWRVDLLLGQKSFEDIQSGCLRELFPVTDGALEKPEGRTSPFGATADSAGFQLAVCAWSLSYVMNAQWGTTKWHGAVNAVLSELENVLRRSHSSGKEVGHRGSAAIVIIETLGTTPTPSRKNSLHQYLEEGCGFQKSWVRTDYTFPTKQDGVAMCKFFFGDAVMQRFIELGPDELTLPECTGIWVKRIQL